MQPAKLAASATATTSAAFRRILVIPVSTGGVRPSPPTDADRFQLSPPASPRNIEDGADGAANGCIGSTGHENSVDSDPRVRAAPSPFPGFASSPVQGKNERCACARFPRTRGLTINNHSPSISRNESYVERSTCCRVDARLRHRRSASPINDSFTITFTSRPAPSRSVFLAMSHARTFTHAPKAMQLALRDFTWSNQSGPSGWPRLTVG